METPNTAKLEVLLKQVSEEMNQLYKEGYSIDISLPHGEHGGCSLSVYKPIFTVEGRFPRYAAVSQ